MLIRTPLPAMPAGNGSSTAAPWRALFLEHLDRMSAPMCAVSTVHPAESSGSGSSSGSSSSGGGFGATTTARVRTCVCRGMWASLPDNERNPAPRNPTGVYESDMPVFTTDARMAKAWELSASADLADRAGTHGAGGGAAEAMWWAAAAGTQWRIRGRAWLLGPDAEGAGGAQARAAIGSRMRPAEAAATESGTWSWAREVTAHFGNMSPAMRGSFRNPPPGRVRCDKSTAQLGQPVADDDLDNAAARANFRVCVIVPEEVDVTDLSRGDDPRRWLYTYVGVGGQAVHAGGVVEGEWEVLEVWP